MNSILAQCISLIFALLLPTVSISLYFYSNDGENKIDFPKIDNDIDAGVRSNTNTDYDLNTMEKSYYQIQQNELQMPTFSFKHAIARIGEHIKTSYSNTVVIQWSILWAISMCGFLQVTNKKKKILLDYLLFRTQSFNQRYIRYLNRM